MLVMTTSSRTRSFRKYWDTRLMYSMPMQYLVYTSVRLDWLARAAVLGTPPSSYHGYLITVACSTCCFGFYLASILITFILV
ncbi:hypothetical protein BDZ91DRAFT_716549 [Kalaharituber pfeilii]|nr:hypothetical protein BDZ91DRAFT_716549 [Kalaharituber pfeilii]